MGFVGGQMLSVEFATDERVIAEILPPPLELGDAPNVRAMVGRRQSNCVGDFHGGAIYVQAELGEDTGAWDGEGFNFKAGPSVDGKGLEEDAILTRRGSR